MLYLTEPIDEVAIQNLAEYDDKKFVDVSREGIDLGADDQDTKKVMPLPSLCILSVLICMYLERASIWVQTAQVAEKVTPVSSACVCLYVWARLVPLSAL